MSLAFKNPPAPISLPELAATNALTDVLDQSVRIEDIVAECAEELAIVNDSLKQELATQQLPTAVEEALEKSEAVETKVQVASTELSIVNNALQEEIDAREALQMQLALVTKQKEAADHAAMHDSLTDLPNRALFHDRLEHALTQAKRHGWQLAVLFIDLDKFKTINDTLGHASGDNLLQTIAFRLKDTIRADDTISRYGGDEFLALLTHVGDKQMVKRVAEKMSSVIEAITISSMSTSASTSTSTSNSNSNTSNATQCMHIGASIGVALYPDDGLTADTLIHAADKAMYRVKQDQSMVGFA
jgi:diguanylate cyclase